MPATELASATPTSETIAAMPRAVDELFARAAAHGLGADELDCAVSALVGMYPEAPVLAMQDLGLVVALPPTISLRRNPVLEARAGVDVICEPDRARVLAAWDRVLKDGAARAPGHLVSCPETPVVFCGFDLRERHGVVLAVFIPTDAEDAQVLREQATDIPDSKPRFAAIHKDERAFITHVDDALTQIVGWPAEALVGHKSLEFIHPEDHALAIDNWMQMVAAPGPARRVRLRHSTPDGSWVWFEVTNHNLLADPAHGCVVTEMVDISEEMAASEALRAQQRLLDRLAKTVPVGFLQLDAERRIVYTNPRLYEIFAVDDPAESIDRLFASVAEPDRKALERGLGAALAAGEANDVEVALRVPPDAELRFCVVNLRPLHDDDGAVTGAIACVADVTDGTRMREELKRRATFDHLTGCYNRESIMLALGAEIASGRPESDRAVLFLDVDHFKQANDRHGHAAGDELLRSVVARLQGALREGDLLGRIGGDELLLICANVGSPEGAMRVAERMADSACFELSLPTGALAAKASMGVAWSRGNERSAEQLVAEADQAMYASKQEAAGRPKLAGALACA